MLVPSCVGGSALLCVDVRHLQIDVNIKVTFFLTLKFEVCINMHLRYMSTNLLILTSKRPAFKRLQNLMLISNYLFGIDVKTNIKTAHIMQNIGIFS
jgi:hypothetical protein